MFFYFSRLVRGAGPYDPRARPVPFECELAFLVLAELERRETERRIDRALALPAERTRLEHHLRRARSACDPAAAAEAFRQFKIPSGERRSLPPLVAAHIRLAVFAHGFSLETLGAVLNGYTGAASLAARAQATLQGQKSIDADEWSRICRLLERVESFASDSLVARGDGSLAVARMSRKPLRWRRTVSKDVLAEIMVWPLKTNPVSFSRDLGHGAGGCSPG